MPTRPAQTAVLDNRSSARQATWSGLLNGDDGAALDLAGPANALFVTVSGAFGTGGSVTIQGSADGIAWAALIQVNNSAATFTAATSAGIRGNPRFVRPLVTAGDGATNLTARLYLAKAVADA